MKVRERTTTTLVLRESGLTTRHWGIFTTLLAGGASLALYLDGDTLPLPAIILLGAALVAGPVMAIFTGKRLTHRLDKSTGTGRIDYPTLMTARYETKTFPLAEVRAVRPTRLDGWTAAISRSSDSRRVAFSAEGGFSYVMNDGTLIEAGEFTTAGNEAAAQVEAVSEFLGVPVDTGPRT